MPRIRRLTAFLLALLLAFALFACGQPDPIATDPAVSGSGMADSEPAQSPAEESPEPTPEPSPEPSPEPAPTIDRDGYYYDPESVVLYIHTYGALPPNFLTKSDARSLGWKSGSVERFMAGGAIGGDTFQNREGLLPKASGRRYTECDMYTNGKSNRGACRLVFSNDGLYFYTSDHYGSFRELYVTEEGTVAWK